jgi:cellulose 1,4-beta-cellobiosidase
MVNRSANKYRRLVIPLRDKRTTLVAIALVLSLLGGGAVLARRGSLWPAMLQNSRGKQESAVAPEGFAASSPAKEYVYAGSRLIATEEPAGSGPPAAPTGLTAAPGNAQVSLNWNASFGATSYNVKRSTVTGGPYGTIATGVTAPSYTNTGLTNGTTYYYVVTALNATGGESPNSNQASATPSGGSSPPPAPTGLTATAGNAQVSLSWNASSGATSYNVKRSTTNGGPYSTIATGLPTTAYTDTGLTNGITYYYVVTAFNTTGGESSNSNQASATPSGGSSPPPAPTGLTATAGNAQVSLSWTASSGATSYNVKRSTTNGGPYSTIATGVTATSYLNTGLTNGTTYYYVVSASNAGGESLNSNQASATPTSGGGGTAPTLSGMSPATAIQGASFALTINGSNLSGATSVDFGPPNNITVSNITSTASQVNCAVSIGATAQTGGRTVRVTTASGGTSTNYLVFVINSSSPAPTISGISPTQQARGTTFTLTITGTNLSQTSSVNFNKSTGITVSNIVANSTQVTATISISASATAIVRQVSVTTPGGTSNSMSFTVQ